MWGGAGATTGAEKGGGETGSAAKPATGAANNALDGVRVPATCAAPGGRAQPEEGPPPNSQESAGAACDTQSR